MAGQLADARNRARVSPSFREGGESLVAPPTGMMRNTTQEEAPEEGGSYTSPEYTPRTTATADGDESLSRGTMGGMPAGAAGLASMPDVSAQLNPLKKVGVVGKVIRSLIPDQWPSWFSFDSWKDPVEIGLRLSILKIVFWIVFLGLIIVAAVAAIEVLDPTNLL